MILFRAQLDGGAMFLERNAFTYNFYDKDQLREGHSGKNAKADQLIRSHAYRVSFAGSAEDPVVTALDPTPDHCNFFIGKDRTKWASNVKNFREVRYQELYPFIDLQVLGMQNSVKYNFIVSPGGSTTDIRMIYDGVAEIAIKRKELRIRTSLNEIIEQKPFAYQMKNGMQVEVPCEFRLRGNELGFYFPKGYDKARELVIDPVLVFACSSGSTADNFGMTATYDEAGNLYGGGTTYSVGYPTTLGAFDPSYNGIVAYGRTDVAITKFDSSGTFLVYSTYLGGALGTEVVSSLIVNANDELLLFGATGSSDFPVTASAYDTVFSGGDSIFFASNGTKYASGTDLYVAHFNASGTALLASTFVGGTENEGANSSPTLKYNYGDNYRGEIQLDAFGNCYIASCSYSADFPVTPGCFQPLPGGNMDGVVFKMDAMLSTILWSSYLGGAVDDLCNALTIDAANNIYITGGTSSPDFPSTPAAFSPAYNGGIADGFITKISSDGSAILSSTYVGTNVYDQSFLIQLDDNMDVYIVGQTLGTMPVSPGAYSNPNSKQFIWQLDNNLSTQLITTIFGNGNGTVNISPSAFLVDNCGNIYVCGWGGNIMTGMPTTGMPITADAHQPATDGFNFYLMVLGPDADSLLYATYFGGPNSREHVDGGTSRFDKKGIVYHAVCSGCGGYDDFPVTPGSWPNSGTNVNHSTNCNMGVFKFDFQTAGVDAQAVISPNDTLCTGETMTFNNSSSNALSYEWDFGDGSPLSSDVSPSHMYITAGTFTVTLVAFDPDGCYLSDTATLNVIVVPRPVVELGSDTTLCEAPSLLLDAGNPGCFYSWSTGETTQSITATDTMLYFVTVSNNVCEAADSIIISRFMTPELGLDTSLCEGDTLQIDASASGATYLWWGGETTPAIDVTTTGDYWVELNWGICTNRDTVHVNFIPYPSVNLPSAMICADSSLLLDAGPAEAYSWSTGETTQTITVANAGEYIVTASNYTCATKDTSTITVLAPPVLVPDTILCQGQNITLNVADSGASYLWSTGQTGTSINVAVGGTYWIEASTGFCTKYDTISITFVPYPVVDLPEPIQICEETPVTLDAGSGALEYLWSTGETTQTITIPNGGAFWVTASNYSCDASDSTVITVFNTPEFGPDVTLCDGQTINLDVTSPGATYLWSTGASGPSILVSAAGAYWVEIDWDLCEKKDTINVSFLPYPVVNLPATTQICYGTSVTYDAGAPATGYVWSTGQTTQTIQASTGGLYTVEVFNGPCSTLDSALLNVEAPIGWEDEAGLCNVMEYSLDAGAGGDSYLWSTGATEQTIEVSESGTYWVVMTKGGCTLSDTITVSGALGMGVLWYPNSFTPNSNGLNDEFLPKGNDLVSLHLLIFDRWGEVIYETSSLDKPWDGTYKGVLCKQDVYVWKAEYRTKCTGDKLNTKIGHVTLIR